MPDILSRLEDLTAWRNEMSAFEENTSIQQSLGVGFRGTSTNWEELGNAVEWAQQISAHGLSYETAKTLVSGDSPLELRRLYVELEKCFERLSLLEEQAEFVVLTALAVTSLGAIGTAKTAAFLREWCEWFRRALNRLKESARSTDTVIADFASAIECGKAALDHENAILGNERFKESFGSLARGVDSDWTRISATLLWACKVEMMELPKGVQNWLFDPDFSERIQFFLRILGDATSEWQRIEDALSSIQEFGPLDRDWLFGSPEKPWRGVVDGCQRLMLARHLIPQWIIFQGLRSEAENRGVMFFVEKAIHGEFPIPRIADVYMFSLAEARGFAEMRGASQLAQFSQQSFESIRSSFAKADRRLLDLNRKLVASEAAQRSIPSGISRGSVTAWTEGALLNREMQKQRGHLPIRQLMLRATQAVRALKPCMMMSPLSVAQYLDPALPKFDLVVMDEASQIRPEDALGAVARAKQLVVVGDTKQMPPSDFWQKQADDDDAQEEEDTGTSAAQEAESVLECALHSFQPVYRLKWHYRSLHEDLIRFSNHYYYDDELIVFPSANPNDPNRGIKFHYLPEGRFQSGSRVNIVEAEAVARAAVDHLLRRPQESLLVATMNRSQQSLIDDLIDKICQSNQAAREVVEEARNREFEKFIVRNLENVQGDQRDVIFISFTYGKDPESGRVMQRWGPITGKSGRRRLNVLFTRAKMRVEVFSSLLSQDVVSEPGVQGGVNDLKNYLRFAQDGVLFEEGRSTGESPENHFELSVMNVIRSAGLVPVPQVGVASYRIDIGVCRPGETGQYLLGVECDGATYHSSKWARDRDRIREEVLRSRGWKLYRVWSTDWFRQHEDAKRRLLNALERSATMQDLDGPSAEAEESLPAVTAPVTISKIAAASGASVYEIRSLAWKTVNFVGDDSETIPTGQALAIVSAAGCRLHP